jgi:hypothetical protein
MDGLAETVGYIQQYSYPKHCAFCRNHPNSIPSDQDLINVKVNSLKPAETKVVSGIRCIHYHPAKS